MTDKLTSVRFPSIVYTEDYYNNPIQFTAPERLYPSILIPQSGSMPPTIERDITQFLLVKKYASYDKNEVLSINTISPQYNKEKIIQRMNTTFTEFGTE